MYIPGDSKQVFNDYEFVFRVGEILRWASDHNNEEGFHFPVVGVSWGMMSMIKSQLKDTGALIDLPEWMAGEAIQQNLNLTPLETFTYDEINGYQLEDLFDKIDFYNELDVGFPLKDFVLNRSMRAFVPAATWDSNDLSTAR